jgi:glucosamine--fructose-6-phosphate aminotransferase (isomerizing)
VLALTAGDAAEESVLEVAGRLAGQGARVLATSGGAPPPVTPLPVASAHHPLTAPLALVGSFYGFVEAYARHRGHDPDRPPHLRKVTRTT